MSSNNLYDKRQPAEDEPCAICGREDRPLTRDPEEPAQFLCDRHAPAEPRVATVDTLEHIMPFDNVVEILPGGVVEDRPDMYAPEWPWTIGDTAEIDTSGLGEWVPQSFNGPASGDGPLMHPSESIGGGMAAALIEAPGVYVVVPVNDGDEELDNDNEVCFAGWTVLKWEGDSQGLTTTELAFVQQAIDDYTDGLIDRLKYADGDEQEIEAALEIVRSAWNKLSAA